MKDMSSYGETDVLWPRSDAVSPKVADVIDHRVMSSTNEIKQERPHPFYPQSSVQSPLPGEKEFKSYPLLNSTFNDTYDNTSASRSNDENLKALPGQKEFQGFSDEQELPGPKDFKGYPQDQELPGQKELKGYSDEQQLPGQKDFKGYSQDQELPGQKDFRLRDEQSLVEDQENDHQENRRPSALSPTYSESESFSQSPDCEDPSQNKSFRYGDKPDPDRSFSFSGGGGGKTPEKSYPTSPNDSSYPYGLKRNSELSHSFHANDTPESSPLKGYHHQESSPLKGYHSQNHPDTSPDSHYASPAEKSKYSLDLSNGFPSYRGIQRDSLMHIKETLPATFPLPAIPQLNISPGGNAAFPNADNGANSKYFCHLCSYAGDSKTDFDQHMTIHFEYSCPHCDYTSRTEGRLKRHIKDFHTDDNDPNGRNQRAMPGRPKVYRCKQCDFVATVKTDFWQHSRTHIKEDKILQCPRCPFVTEYKHHLEYHLRNHFGSKPFRCNKCNYSCVNKSMLNSHMKSHTNVYQYRCADCTYATKYCHSLKLHLKKYNHKPAMVLNNDGSLPQGLDADLSGLSLLTKRGPPRGPRTTKRDEHQEFVNPMFAFQRHGMMGMPNIPPGINGAMMNPYWPLMSGWNPHLGMGSNAGLPPIQGIQNRIVDPGAGGSKCSLCGFTAESPEKLNAHLMKVHATENQDLFNAYGINSDSFMDESSKTKPRNGLNPLGTPDRPSSHSDMLHVRTDTGSESSKASPHSWPANTPNHHQSSANVSSRSLPELYHGSSRDPEKETDILREMTLKFGSGNGHANGIQNSVSPPSMDKEGALDLTKPRSDSPNSDPIYPSHKRPYPDQEFSSSAENSINGEANTPNPRKRSRKGKAYKLDTLCLKLQEEKTAYESESESAESNGEGPTEMVTDSRGSEHVNPTGDGGDSDGSNPLNPSEEDHYGKMDRSDEDCRAKTDLTKLQNNFKFLNGEEEEEENLGEGVKDGQESPLDLLNSVYQNRRKPMSSALRRGAEVAWKILNDPVPGEKPTGKGEITDVPESPTNFGKQEQEIFTPSPTSKKHLKDFPFHRAESYECTFCDIAFRDCVMYTMHMGYHGYQNPYKCNMCGNISRDKVEFFLHIARTAHN